MIPFIIVVSTLLSYAACRRYIYMLSPANLFCLVILAHLFSFYVTIGLGLLPDSSSPLANSWRYRNASGFRDHLTPVCIVFAAALSVGLLAEIAGNITTNRSRYRVLRSTRTRERQRFVKSFNRFVRTAPVQYSVLGGAISLYLLLMVHFIDGGLSAAASHAPYRYMKEADNAHLSNFISSIIHTRCDLIALASISMVVYFMSNRLFFFVLILLPIAIYSSAVELFLASRSVALAFALATGVAVLFGRGSMRLVMASLTALSCLFTFGLVIAIRETGYSGANALWNNVTSAFLHPGTLPWYMLTFSGGHRTAYAFERPGIFSLHHQILSFSPLPSFVDHFDLWRSRYANMNFNLAQPLGAFGELIDYSPIVVFAAAIGFFFVLYSLSVMSRKSHPIYSAAMFVITFTPIIAIPDYNIRSYVRLLIVITIASGVLYQMTGRGFARTLKGASPPLQHRRALNRRSANAADRDRHPAARTGS